MDVRAECRKHSNLHRSGENNIRRFLEGLRDTILSLHVLIKRELRKICKADVTKSKFNTRTSRGGSLFMINILKTNKNGIKWN